MCAHAEDLRGGGVPLGKESLAYRLARLVKGAANRRAPAGFPRIRGGGDQRSPLLGLT